MSLSSEQFLKNLYRELKWRVAPEEAEDIANDYREFFEEEQKHGKTEAQIVGALGSPQQVIKTILADRKPTLRHAFYIPCLAVSVIMALMITVLAVRGHGRLWYYLQYSGPAFAFVLFAPFPALLLYCLQPAHRHKAKRADRLFCGAAGFALLLFCVSSALMYLFLREIYEPHFNLEPLTLIRYVYYPLIVTTLAACLAWLSGIFKTEKLGRYSPALYFICTAVQIATLHYISILSAMDLSDNPMPFEDFAWITFHPVSEHFACAFVGIALWCVLQYFFHKRGDK